MTPHSRAILQETLIYFESKVIQHRVIEPNSLELRSGKRAKPRSQKQIKGLRTLDRAYIEQDKARVAAAEVLEAEKVANREARRLAKELKAMKAKEAANASKQTRGGSQAARGRGRGHIARSRTSRRSKYDAEGADLKTAHSSVSVDVLLPLCE